jgi:flavin-dependent dehydrogenase
MRYALVSGHMAGRALLARRPAEYERSFRERFTGFLRASVVNRYFYERLGDTGYARLLHRLARAADARDWLRHFYAPRLWKTLWFPIARIAVDAARRRAEAQPRTAPALR